MCYNKEFFENRSQDDPILCENGCGHCEMRRIMTDVAKEFVAKEIFDIAAWEAEVDSRWANTKYFKLWQEEKKAGRDPYLAFKERGWEP
jgi:hypothetical protein